MAKSRKNYRKASKNKKDERQMIKVVIIGTIILMILIYLAYRSL
jgi:hypothetical protein